LIVSDFSANKAIVGKSPRKTFDPPGAKNAEFNKKLN
jgi:hypothetical protein